MTIDNLLTLLTSGLVLILVGIFLAPIIRDFSGRQERQESHTSLEDLVKRRERWIQVQGLASTRITEWKVKFPSESKLIEDFLTWGDTKLLDQVNAAIGSERPPLTMDELRERLSIAPPPKGDIKLIEALSLPVLPPPPNSDHNDQADS